MPSVMEIATKEMGFLIEAAQANLKYFAPVYNVEGFGAVGDGETDNTSAIQAAIAAAEADGGEVRLPPGVYCFSSELVVTKPIRLVGTGMGDDTSNANADNEGVTTLRWIGPAGGTMIRFQSATTNNWLVGCEVEGIVFDGNKLAGTAIYGASIAECLFHKLHIQNVRDQGILIDGGNGVLSRHNYIDDYHFVWGVATECQNAHGLVLGNSADGLTTQTKIGTIHGLVFNGSLVKIIGADNNIFERIHGVVQSGGTGKALYLSNGAVPARNNVIHYLIGPVHAESQTFGNRIEHYISEGGGLTVDSGAQIHYTVEDYGTAGVFETHKYVMSDQMDIPVGAIAVVDGSAAAGVASAQWPCFNLPDGADSRIGVVIPPVYRWNKGIIKKLVIWFTTGTANTSAQWVAQIRVLTNKNGFGNATPEFNQTVNIPVSDTTFVTQKYEVDLNIVYDRDDAIFLSVQRLGTHANDTAQGNIQIFGMTLIYQSSGPQTIGSGTYAVTSPGY